MGVFLWAEIVLIVSIGKFITTTLPLHREIIHRFMKSESKPKPMFIHTISREQSEWEERSGYFMHLWRWTRREKARSSDIWSISASPSAMILLFMLVQSVTRSIVVYLTLLVCFGACACAHTVHTVLCCAEPVLFYYGLLSKIFRMLFIMRC